jgi:Spy/CpxP family protein refolding chaperone
MNKPWKLVWLLAGIFLAGGVTGAFVAMRVGREMFPRRPSPDQWAPQHLKRLAERLDLKPEQQELIRPIIKRNMDELSRLRAASMAETRTVFERMNREVAEQLTPEQRTKLEQMNKEFRERTRKFGFDRPGGPGGPRKDQGDREHPPGEPPGQPPGDKPPGP